MNPSKRPFLIPIHPIVACLFVAAVSMAIHPLEAADSWKVTPTHRDVRYGSFHRNLLDVYLPASADKPTPVLIFFHGGGWMTGDKSGVDPSWCLDENIAVVSANYRFTTGSPDAAPYPAPMRDAARVVQFVRSKAADWNLDSDRIALSGSSAGGVMAMWIGYQDDMAEPDSGDVVARQSTRVKCVLPINAPTTFDREWILNTVGGPKQIHVAAYPLFRIQSLDELEQPDKSVLVRSASAVTHVSPDDPPTFLRYSMDLTQTPLPETVDQNVSIHHPRFGQYLKSCLDDAGVPCVFRYRGDSETLSQRDFLLRYLVD